MAACRVLCVSRTVFRISLVMYVRCEPYRVVRLTIYDTRRKQQCKLPEDDRVIEICGSVLSVLMSNFRFIK